MPKRLSGSAAEACQIHLRAIVKAINDVHPKRMFLKLDAEPFNHEKQVLIATGKNALEMALSCNEKSKTGFQKAFILQVDGYFDEPSLKLMPPHWIFRKTSHPLPDKNTIDASEEILNYLQSIPKDTIVHFCISGGTSSSFAVPEVGLDLNTYQQIIFDAINSGFDIHELNYLRALIDRTKGGKTAEMIPDNPIYTWVVSDVIDDNPAYVGSGPTVAGMARHYKVEDWLQQKIQSLNLNIRFEYLLELFTMAQETKENLSVSIVSTRADFARALQQRLDSSGFSNEIVSLDLAGDIKECATDIMQTIAEKARSATDELRHTLIWMGEPTIKLDSEATKGKGGRISALAVLMAEHLRNHPHILFLGLATDGKDGRSPDPAYVVSSETWQHLRPLGGPFAILKKGNSGKALSSLGYGIPLSNTQINLLDLYLAIFT